MQNEDFYKPTNIRDSIFASFELPEQSGVQAFSQKKKSSAEETRADKYGFSEQTNEDDQFNGLGFSMLQEVSKFQPKTKYESPMSIIEEVSDMKKQVSDLTRENSTQKQLSQQKSKPSQKPKLGKKPIQQIRRAPLRNKPTSIKDKKQSSQKSVIDLDTQIGQVRQWAHRDDNQKESDFDKSDDEQEPYEMTTSNKRVQDQLRKKAEQKAKMLQQKIQNKNYSQPKGLGLKAKAEELRRKNEQLVNNQNEIVQNHFQQKIEQSTDNIKINLIPQLNSSLQKDSHQTKKQVSMPYTQPKQQEFDSEDDPWEKINENTKKEYQKKQQLPNNPLSKEQILDFYTKKFIFNQEDVISQFQINNQLQQQKVASCWEALFGCLKSKKDDQGQKSNQKHKDRTALRLLAISKTSLTNTQEEFFILKEIWGKLTKKTFSRYGNHWNDIGFQGRDPATDLRATGVLSLLQWYLFIEICPQRAKSAFEWASENDFPLALTHIKATEMFLKLLKNGNIRAKSWNEYQRYYNCIVDDGIFGQIKKDYDLSDNIGEKVDKILQDVQQNLSQYYRSYVQRKKQ